MHTEFMALLNRADITQAGFARLTGVTARQSNNWAKGRAVVPRWAVLIATVMEDFTPEAMTISAQATVFDWSEVLGVSASSNISSVRRAMLQLAGLYHPDKGGQSDQMVRVNAAYEQALNAMSMKNTPNR